MAERDHAEPYDGKPHPALRLQRPLPLGAPVRVARGVYADREGTVEESLTDKSATQWITGGARYGVRLTDGRLLDFCRYEIRSVPRRRAPRKAAP